jgi:hypothetical protein
LADFNDRGQLTLDGMHKALEQGGTVWFRPAGAPQGERITDAASLPDPGELVGPYLAVVVPNDPKPEPPALREAVPGGVADRRGD